MGKGVFLRSRFSGFSLPGMLCKLGEITILTMTSGKESDVSLRKDYDCDGSYWGFICYSYNYISSGYGATGC